MTASATDAPRPVTESPPAKAKRSRAKILLPTLILVAATGFGVAYLRGMGKETTDDAFVEAHVAIVAARVPGQVLRVFVRDNQPVEAGEPLVELDDRDAKVRVTSARADLESAKANLAVAQAQAALVQRTVEASLRQAKGGVTQAQAMSGTSKAAIDQARADVTVAESRRSLAETELKRVSQLAANGSVAQAELDQKRAEYDQSAGTLAQAQARLSGATVGIASASGSIETAVGRLLAAQTGPEQLEATNAQVEVAKARIEQAQAALDQAELNLSYVTVRAPSAGVVSRRTVEVGQMVDAARPLLAITVLADVWVVANFKEDQLEKMRPGQPASVTIDAFPGRTLNGHVESLAGGTGSRFSLLPADNASGNFTKVVQRLPVLVHLDDKHDDVPLRPGMSTNVTVDVGK